MSPAKRTLLFAMAAACVWPVWQWFLMRAADASRDPWGWLALGTAAFALFHNRRSPAIFRYELPTLLLAVYATAYLFVPPLLRAAIAMTALAALLSAIVMDKRMHLALWGLLLLALPVIASLNFYLGYPLRVAVGAASAFLLQTNGFAVFREGTLLNWSGHLVAIDAPCSGVKMLWAGLYLSLTLAALLRFGNRMTALLAAFAVVAVLSANVLRATALFFVETGIVPLAPVWHEGIGVIAFAFAALAMTYAAQKLGETAHAT